MQQREAVGSKKRAPAVLMLVFLVVLLAALAVELPAMSSESPSHVV